MATASFQERKIAIFQLRQGKTMEEVAQMMGRSLYWVSKWHKRYQAEGWQGLHERSRAPKSHGNQLSPEIREAICQTRLELEVAAALGTSLKYVGGRAIKTRLKQNGIKPLPSVSSIERVIREAGLVRAKAKSAPLEINYPHLRANAVHQLCQVDIVPHFLQGGQRVACFNALDVVSRYPTGKAFGQRRSLEAIDFLIHLWQEIGIPQYTQVDNEACFSGGFTHPYVLGKVVRLALAVGTELLFSPVAHPKSNGFVERFHQDYNRHVWEDTYLENMTAVNQQARQFFQRYRDRLDHSELDEQTPRQLHQQTPPRKLAADFTLTAAKLPLREGRIHFIRRVSNEGQVRVLNIDWAVPDFDPTTGVWVTIDFQTTGATLSIFDQAPDVQARTSLITYPFPLDEPVYPPEKDEVITHEMEQQQPQEIETVADAPNPILKLEPSDDVLADSEDDWDLTTDLPYGPFYELLVFSMY